MPPPRSDSLRFALLTLSAALALTPACASDDSAGRDDAPADTNKTANADGDGKADAAAAEESADEEAPENERLKLPTTWEEVPTRFEFLCPGPVFALEQPSTVDIKGQVFEIRGSTWARTEPHTGPLVIGIVGAPKDASAATRRNLKKAHKRFKRAKASLVLVNGDLAEDNELEDVLVMLGEVFTSTPVAVHAGNIEWAGAFTHAFVKAHRVHAHLVNLNWVRHLDLGEVSLISLPGYYDGRFSRNGACRYIEKNLDEVRALAASLRDEGDTVILTSHGPPRSRGEHGIDFAFQAGNVGDQRITDILDEEGVRYGLFSHILEAGGRATNDLKSGAPLKLPVKKPQERLYLNAGSSSSYPWQMHGGRMSHGIAMIFRLDDKGATAKRLKLR